MLFFIFRCCDFEFPFHIYALYSSPKFDTKTFPFSHFSYIYSLFYVFNPSFLDNHKTSRLPLLTQLVSFTFTFLISCIWCFHDMYLLKISNLDIFQDFLHFSYFTINHLLYPIHTLPSLPIFLYILSYLQTLSILRHFYTFPFLILRRASDQGPTLYRCISYQT